MMQHIPVRIMVADLENMISVGGPLHPYQGAPRRPVPSRDAPHELVEAEMRVNLWLFDQATIELFIAYSPFTAYSRKS